MRGSLNNNQKAIEAYESSRSGFSPDDPEVQFQLAELYRDAGAFDQARGQYAKLLARDPKFMDALFGYGPDGNHERKSTR